MRIIGAAQRPARRVYARKAAVHVIRIGHALRRIDRIGDGCDVVIIVVGIGEVRERFATAGAQFLSAKPRIIAPVLLEHYNLVLCPRN